LVSGIRILDTVRLTKELVVTVRLTDDSELKMGTAIPGSQDPGIPEIFQSRNPGIEPHSIPGFRD